MVKKPSKIFPMPSSVSITHSPELYRKGLADVLITDIKRVKSNFKPDVIILDEVHHLKGGFNAKRDT